MGQQLEGWGIPGAQHPIKLNVQGIKEMSNKHFL